MAPLAPTSLLLRTEGRARGDETRQRLLDAAEKLFAHGGVRGVSLRDIVKTASVNLAAVSYHFDSKENLFVQVFVRASEQFGKHLTEALERIPPHGAPDRLEQIIEAFLGTGLRMGEATEGSISTFIGLRNWLVAEDPALAAALLAQTQDSVGHAYIDALLEELPGLSRYDMVWRFHTLLAAMVYTVAHGGRLSALTDGKADPHDIDETLRQLVPILAGAFRTPAPGAPRKRRSKRPSRP
ncbi:MAG TPA: TetR family transcriptional regulator [Burkholderiaceae bacterium]|nr:TetR family transcriptional regulator [Burkholderiaceae bacterium]